MLLVLLRAPKALEIMQRSIRIALMPLRQRRPLPIGETQSAQQLAEPIGVQKFVAIGGKISPIEFYCGLPGGSHSCSSFLVFLLEIVGRRLRGGNRRSTWGIPSRPTAVGVGPGETCLHS